MEKDSKISLKGLSLVFGRKKEQENALRLMDAGKGKKEIQDETGATVAINSVNFDIQEGEIFVIMGLSGSGKSTLIRCVNRLIEPTRGTVNIDDVDIIAADPGEVRRLRLEKTAMVFQNFGLLPHRSVRSNIAFGLEIRKVPTGERLEKAREILEEVGLEGYEENMVGELSGGMQQRVGLARALAVEPEILLMDEAFSALDPLIRGQMQDNLLELQERIRKTILFITHDLDEALKLGDRIAIMRDGRIEQVGTPEEILLHPANDHIRTFLEDVEKTNIITASSLARDQGKSASVSERPGSVLQRIEEGTRMIGVLDEKDQYIGLLSRRALEEAEEKGAMDLEEMVDREVPLTDRNTPVIDLLPIAWKQHNIVAVGYGGKKYLGWTDLDTIIQEIASDRTEKTQNAEA